MNNWRRRWLVVTLSCHEIAEPMQCATLMFCLINCNFNFNCNVFFNPGIEIYREHVYDVHRPRMSGWVMNQWMCCGSLCACPCVYAVCVCMCVGVCVCVRACVCACRGSEHNTTYCVVLWGHTHTTHPIWNSFSFGEILDPPVQLTLHCDGHNP